MTRQERLEFCTVCNNREFNPNKGIVCKLTGHVAEFEKQCSEYIIDEKVEALELYKSERNKNKTKKKREKKGKVRDSISKNDTYFIIAVSLLATLTYRVIYYTRYLFDSEGYYLAYLIVTSIALTLSLFLRPKKRKQFTILGEIKFLIFSIVLTTISNAIYIAIVYSNYEVIPQILLLYAMLTITCGVLAFIIAKPIMYLFITLKRRNEKNI